MNKDKEKKPFSSSRWTQPLGIAKSVPEKEPPSPEEIERRKKYVAEIKERFGLK